MTENRTLSSGVKNSDKEFCGALKSEIMGIFYNIAMLLMELGIRVAALFNPKARKWVRGRRHIFLRLKRYVHKDADIAWFHAASLGEFEQGRPVIERFREKYPDYKILVTFFSPSGYEVRKKYKGADYVFYLPSDTSWNARRFVALVNPKVAVFIKYEFWANYLKYLKKNGTRTFIISSIFQPNSAFFNKWYGHRYRKLLGCFEHIFVQNDESRRLLNAVGIKNVTVAGDTRFDRVYAIATKSKQLPLVESFAAGASVFVAGSTWPADEELIMQLAERSPETKFIIAPHEIHPERIEKLIASTTRRCVRFTQLKPEDDLSAAEVLFVDTIGILSSVYRYGRFAYIGGGFGVGIHNTLEAATFGLPLAFGPNYMKFKEARDLIALGGAVSITSFEELNDWFFSLRDDDLEYDMASGRCRDYVKNGRGATAAILSEI